MLISTYQSRTVRESVDLICQLTQVAMARFKQNFCIEAERTFAKQTLVQTLYDTSTGT